MFCPFCKQSTVSFGEKVASLTMIIKKYDYHKTKIKSSGVSNDLLSILYECPTCLTTVETSQQVRITVKK